MFYIYIYFLISNYLAVWGLSCGMWDVCCIMQDLLWWCTVSVVALCGFSSCNTQAPECTGSLIVAHGLSCPATFFFLTLQYCIGFAIYWLESTTGVHVFPILNPPHLPSHPIPLGLPNAPAPSTLSHALNLDWRFVSHMIIYMFQCHSSISSSPRPLLQSPKDSLSMWDLVPQSAIEPASPALVGRILNHWTTRDV